MPNASWGKAVGIAITITINPADRRAGHASSLDIGLRRERRALCRQVRHHDRGQTAMQLSTPRTFTERNRLLLALPRADYRALLPDLEAVSPSHGAVLFEARTRIRHVYFPQHCVISLLAAAGEGPGVEVGLIGNEGMAGLSVFLGAALSVTQAVLQIPDGASRMEVGAFGRAIAERPSLQNVLRRYTQSVFSQVTQCLACNQRHAVGPRCARWLLMAHDRVGADRFELTHDFLGQMLGAQRPTVSVTARGLQSLGFIKYARGIITILDRAGLETAACTCYDLMEADYARAFA